jgi:protein-tyrosine phosphatase
VAGEALDPPLRVDWIPASALDDGRPGALGLTFLPGKRGASTRYPGRVYRRELEADLESLRELGLAALVLLVEDHELERWGDLDIVELAGAHGVNVLRFPVRDGGTPPPGGMEDILSAVAEHRLRGPVAVACMGGVGRTGTVVACALVDAGWSADAAIGEVRRVRHPEAVETAEQEAFVRNHADHRAIATGTEDPVRSRHE